ncbi:MAG: CvpA family protein [Armatimonadota bacterium]|nr:CvpA family protein [Armatimonadota bacterium]MDR7518022.1 CvpA family protein [Armatimonadota bacterium]
MTWLDWMVVAMLVYFAVQGLFKGVVASGLGGLAIVVSYMGAAAALPIIGDRAAMGTPLPGEWARLIAFIFAFFLLYGICIVLISITPGGKRPTLPSQVLGIVAGVAKAMIAAMAAVGVLLASPLSDAFAKDVERAPLARHVAGLQKRYIQDIRRISPIPFPPIGPDHKF